MNIEKAKPSEAEWLDEIIRREFPYTEFNPEKIIDRINNPNYSILIVRQTNIMVGFLDLEFFTDKAEARMNAVYIEDAWRGKRLATALIEQAINECRHKKITRLFLLVKKDNEGAKQLYLDTGFAYEKMHDKIIEGNEVEVWAQKPPELRRGTNAN